MAQTGDYVDNSTPDENVFINASDGLSNEHPSLPSSYESDNEQNTIDNDSFDDLPTSIIVTNIHSSVFVDGELKTRMENLFKSFSEEATFQWLKSFRRLRVNYDNAIDAANARIKLHQYPFDENNIITCYFAQPVTPVSNKNLQLPAPVKQFLISPPASPPAGWEPRDEGEPLVNHDLLAALANLTPGESHEIHAQTENFPGIILHTAQIGTDEELKEASARAAQEEADEAEKENNARNIATTRIMHTRCPERLS